MFALRSHLTPLAAVAVLAVGAGSAVAIADGGDAQITVGAQKTLTAGQTAPFDAAGVKAVRRGKPIPAGYVLVGRTVTIDRKTAGSVGAALKLTCPAGTRARTLGLTGQNGPTLIGDRYEGHKEVRAAVWSPPRNVQSTGTSWLVCR